MRTSFLKLSYQVPFQYPNYSKSTIHYNSSYLEPSNIISNLIGRPQLIHHLMMQIYSKSDPIFSAALPIQHSIAIYLTRLNSSLIYPLEQQTSTKILKSVLLKCILYNNFSSHLHFLLLRFFLAFHLFYFRFIK